MDNIFRHVACECQLIGLVVILFTGNSMLDLRREVNPGTIQMLEDISMVVRDGLEDIK
jgi:hypothetical protein